MHSQEIPDDWEGLDIGPDTVKKFAQALQGAKTVVSVSYTHLLKIIFGEGKG